MEMGKEMGLSCEGAQEKTGIRGDRVALHDNNRRGQQGTRTGGEGMASDWARRG